MWNSHGYAELSIALQKEDAPDFVIHRIPLFACCCLAVFGAAPLGAQQSLEPLIGLGSVRPQVRFVAHADAPIAADLHTLMEAFATSEFGSLLGRVGIATDDSSLPLECTIELGEPEEQRLSWSYRVTLLDLDGSTPLWERRGTGAMPGIQAQYLAQLAPDQVCAPPFFEDYESANPLPVQLEPALPPVGATAVAMSKGRVVVGGGFDNPGLRFFEVSDESPGSLPADPVAPGLGSVFGLISVGDLGFVLVGYGLQLLDLSEGTEPVLLGSYRWPNENTRLTGIEVAGSLVALSHSLVSDGSGSDDIRIALIDVANPASPRLVGDISLPEGSDHIADMHFSDGRLFVAARLSGLLVFDVNDPSQPALLGRYEPGTWSRGIRVSDGVAYLTVSMTTNASSVQVLDVQDPASVRLVREISTSGPAQRLDLDGGRLFVADHAAGLLVFDVSARWDPVLVGRYRTDGTVTEVFAENGLVAVWSPWGSMWILRERR